MPEMLPQHDTTRFLDDLRTAQISNLLVAAVIEFDVGRVLAAGPLLYDDLRERLGLADRSAIVLLTALRSIDLIDVHADHRIGLTAYGQEKMDPDSPFHLRGYLGLGRFSGDVQNMIQCLRDDAPAGNVSFVFHEDGPPSSLDDTETADTLTRAMADRARNVAPMLAAQLDLGQCKHLVDVGGAHGLYSLALLKKYPGLRATIIDRGPPLRVAQEYAEAAGCMDRVTFRLDDAHHAKLDDPADAVLLANLLHDYNEADARAMVQHYAGELARGGCLMVLDSLLESVPEGAPPVSAGPRPVAAYSALLFSICEGRCYRRDEIDRWLTDAGLSIDEATISLPAHGALVTGRKDWKS
ncbi:methyltransferase [Stieleria varia]|uniref:Demethylspheroidene O-methyltransferase n=1 Tax=Stieleria varia TaxID=2528005 RepID=A0A5C5ZMI1_9BACT|nr:methyltransferase [Stieleria varia]TWT88071.1 Demethylspheroidene O-methyltransferase [Stieleria varia]